MLKVILCFQHPLIADTVGEQLAAQTLEKLV